MTTIDLGVCFHRELPAGDVTGAAIAAETAGLDEFWVIEDCFYTSGPTLAAAALTVTNEIGVGIGIVPSVARTAAITAMEFATLAALAPGRFHGGIGHGVQSWMAQMGAQVDSPLTMITETISAVRALLAGETLSVDGRYVTLDDVTLHAPPTPAPLVSAGVRGPKSLAAAGQVADGVVLADFVSPAYVEWARSQMNSDGRITVFASSAIDADGDLARRIMAGFFSEIAADAPLSLQMAPFYDELAARAESTSWFEAAEAMPAHWWSQIGAVGTPDDAQAYVQQLADAGADAVAFFPNPEDQVGDTAAIAGHLADFLS